MDEMRIRAAPAVSAAGVALVELEWNGVRGELDAGAAIDLSLALVQSAAMAETFAATLAVLEAEVVDVDHPAALALVETIRGRVEREFGADDV